jgi:hypothetical protein
MILSSHENVNTGFAEVRDPLCPMCKQPMPPERRNIQTRTMGEFTAYIVTYPLVCVDCREKIVMEGETDEAKAQT